MATDVTIVLHQLNRGDASALHRLLPLVYDSLRGLARRELRKEQPGHTLTPTALVHEAYLKLVQIDHITWRGRAHLLGACAGIMRRLLVDHARARRAGKRGAGKAAVPMENVIAAAETRPAELLALDEALSRLEQLDPRQASVVEFRFFAGMEIEETAEALGVSPATVKRDWMAARAWLNRELSQ